MQTITARLAQVIWGLAIIAIDLQLGHFDVLPDFVGSILVALGAAGLVSWSSQFQTARTLSWSLVAVSIVLLVFGGTFARVIGLAHVALDGALMWFLLGGVMAYGASKARPEWMSWASILRRLYLGVLAAGLVLTWLAPLLGELATLLSRISTLASWIVVGLILYLFHQVKKATDTNPFTVSPNEAADQTQPDELKKAA
jgi:hypothetical protein